MKAIAAMSQPELGAFVQTHLREHGIDVVLSGGAAAGIYSAGKYVSKDLDFVRGYRASMRDIRQAMLKIGFTEMHGRYFSHPDSEHTVEFPPGPLAIGEEPVQEILDIEYPAGILRVISPTDCVKDRLAAFYHFNDRQGLHQAVMVTSHQNINLEEIEWWSDGEGMLHKFGKFQSLLQS